MGYLFLNTTGTLIHNLQIRLVYVGFTLGDMHPSFQLWYLYKHAPDNINIIQPRRDQCDTM